jgi:hypothetical protein
MSHKICGGATPRMEVPRVETVTVPTREPLRDYPDAARSAARGSKPSCSPGIQYHDFLRSP